jgi:hypothetical protein
MHIRVGACWSYKRKGTTALDQNIAQFDQTIRDRIDRDHEAEGGGGMAVLVEDRRGNAVGVCVD